MEAVNSPYYVTTNPRHHVLPPYSHFNTAPVIPIRRCNSESSLTSYIQVYPVLSNPVAADRTTNNKRAHIFHVSKKNNDDDMDIVPSTPHHVCIKNNKL